METDIRKIPVYVLTSTKYVHLLAEFATRFEALWGAPFTAYVSNTDIHHWSDGVIDFVNSIKDDYFVLLHEDFYLTEKVNMKLLEELWELREQYDRVSLLGNHTPERTHLWERYYVHNPDAEYQFSFEASIQNREFLLENLVPGKDPWESERDIAKTARGYVLSSEFPVIAYTDKSRRLEIQ